MAAGRTSAREAAVSIVRTLRDAGHIAYLAGGCVRDALLGMQPQDYDVATDARPEQVRRFFRRSRYVGEAFGVCLVRIGPHHVEVATFRSEWGYSDGRRPDRVEFTDARRDAQRRDFTINGLFEDPLAAENGEGKVIDYVGGVADLRARLVRAVGDPDRRFAEDYLRMLRAVRFAARLDFQIEPRTIAAIRSLARYLGQISRERIGQEVAVMLTSPGAARAVELMSELRLDGPVLNEDHRDTRPRTVAAMGLDGRYPTRLAAWMIDRYDQRGDLDAAAHFIRHDARRGIDRWRAALSLSNDDRDGLRGVLALVERAADWPGLGAAARKRLLASPWWSEALRLLQALDVPERLEVIQREARPLLTEGVAPPPLITGDDLIQLGLTPGPLFGQLLFDLYDAQLEGRVTTREDACRWVRERMNKSG